MIIEQWAMGDHYHISGCGLGSEERNEKNESHADSDEKQLPKQTP